MGDEAEIEAPGGTRLAIIDFIEKPPPSDHCRPDPTQPYGIGNKAPDREISLPEHPEAAADYGPIASRVAPNGETYQSWKLCALLEARDTPQSEIARHLREIVAVEGPVRVNRVYQIYARACGINRVGRMVRSKLNSALYILVRRKDVLLEREGPDDSQINAIARLNGAPRVIVRSAGPRTFWDIPPASSRP